VRSARHKGVLPAQPGLVIGESDRTARISAQMTDQAVVQINPQRFPLTATLHLKMSSMSAGCAFDLGAIRNSRSSAARTARIVSSLSAGDDHRGWYEQLFAPGVTAGLIKPSDLAGYRNDQVHIHPYMDGNGRMGRFLMNLMLASGGYPWTVIPVQERDEYMSAL